MSLLTYHYLNDNGMVWQAGQAGLSKQGGLEVEW